MLSSEQKKVKGTSQPASYDIFSFTKVNVAKYPGEFVNADIRQSKQYIYIITALPSSMLIPAHSNICIKDSTAPGTSRV